MTYIVAFTLLRYPHYQYGTMLGDCYVCLPDMLRLCMVSGVCLIWRQSAIHTHGPQCQLDLAVLYCAVMSCADMKGVVTMNVELCYAASNLTWFPLCRGQQLKDALGAAHMLVDVSYPKWRILFCNGQFDQTTGMSGSELAGQHVWDHFTVFGKNEVCDVPPLVTIVSPSRFQLTFIGLLE